MVGLLPLLSSYKPETTSTEVGVGQQVLGRPFSKFGS